MNQKPLLRRRSGKSLQQLKPLLDAINDKVEQPDYILLDPVQFMHAFEAKKNQEIAGFLAAAMAWGRRDIVVSKVDNLLKRMDYEPFDFVMSYDQHLYDRFLTFKHRTFKPIDVHGLLLTLREIYKSYPDFESFWSECYSQSKKMNRPLLAIFNERFFSYSPDLALRTRKHISNPEKGSPCKRLYMFLRWAIRKNSAVDPGIWSFMPASELRIPLDVHVARQARKFGLLTRRTNDWKAVNQLTQTLSLLNPDDPARYDYALFGIGALNYEIPVRFHLNRV
jgi:uncharacterized protein (TIGR02757 family)